MCENYCMMNTTLICRQKEEDVKKILGKPKSELEKVLAGIQTSTDVLEVFGNRGVTIEEFLRMEKSDFANVSAEHNKNQCRSQEGGTLS